MPVPNPTSRNYQPWPNTGTPVRSVDKENERSLLRAAFEGIENGNLNDGTLTSRVYANGSVTVPKLAADVLSLIESSEALAISNRHEVIASVAQVNVILPFNYTIGSNDLLVYIDGELKNKATHYLESVGNQISLVVPATGGESIVALKLGIAAGTPANRNVVTATEAQELIDVGFSYNVGTDELLVYRNGNKQRVNDQYSETNTTQVTFSASYLTAGDEIEFIVYAAPSADADITGRRVANEGLKQSFLNLLSLNTTFTDLFFDLFDTTGKQDASGDADYFGITQDIGGDGQTYIAKTELSIIGKRAKVYFESNGVGTLTINLSTNDGADLTPITFSGQEVTLTNPNDEFHIQVLFASGARLRNLAVITSPEE